MTAMWWENLGDYILGLDLGPASIGWAIIELDDNRNPRRLVKTGVRRFEAGVLGDIESGRDESRATARRDARGPRRNTWRRQWRMRKLFHKLQHFGLLPEADNDSPDARHELLLNLDAELRRQFAPEDDRIDGHLLPYRLRAKALNEALPPHAVGRAIYHLAQRRGFLSNLKTEDEEDESGIVKPKISELGRAIDESGCRTLGEYFATIDPEEARIRTRWTGRKMFQEEFAAIWNVQAEHHVCMTDDAKKQIQEAIFNQRKLKSQRGLIGRCDLETDKRGAAQASMPVQEFRVWQRINDLKVTAPDGEELWFSRGAIDRDGSPRKEVSAEQRETLYKALSEQGDMSWAAIKRLLGMKRSKEYGCHWVFNLEEGPDKKLIGNRTAAKFISAMGNRWIDLSPDEQDSLINEIVSFESETALANRLVSGWGFSREDARSFKLEKGYASHSRKAIANLLPLMKQGMPYSTARDQAYPDANKSTTVRNDLPPVKSSGEDIEGAFPHLRNPAVERAMSELRKVVNAILRRTGKKPHTIRVELARDLKHARKRREEMTKRRDENTNARDRAKERILQEMGSEKYATGESPLKVRLADECNWICPFTGRSIGMNALVGDQPQFDIEHIIPFSRSLDNSYLNKTLCYHEENRNVKKNDTPFDAYQGTEKYNEIIQRVRRFQGDARARKLALFETEVLPDQDDFAQKQLSDTRYLSRLAAEYLALLYGGKIDQERAMRVQVRPGRATAYLRQRWDLNSIIGHDGKKDRADHRHHAIDAIVVALTDERAVQQLAKAAEEAENNGSPKLFAEVDPPWDDFLQEADRSITSINVSSRVSKKLNGSLHKDTILSKPHTEKDKNGNEVAVHYVRKPLAAMSAGEVDAIVDDKVRELVKAKLKAHGGGPAKVFKDEGNHPHFVARDDPHRVIPIHAARIRKPDHPIAVGGGSRRRYVNPGSNHHIEIVAILDKNGKEKKWEGHLVSRFEAMQRHRRGEAIIQREHGEGKMFKFSLTGGEHVELDGDEARQLVRTVVITDGQVEFVLHTDARPITIRKKEPGARIRCSPDGLRKRCAEKKIVSPLGEIQRASD